MYIGSSNLKAVPDLIKHVFSSIPYQEYIFLGLILFLALPWIFAQIGLYISDFPLLNLIFWARQSTLQEPELLYPNAVHIGTHHGFEGILIIIFMWLTTLLILPLISSLKIRKFFGFFTGIGFAYGFYNAFEDFLTEQIYKRGLVDFRLPNGTTPGLNLQTFVILIFGTLIYFLYIKRRALETEITI
jgi:hypothetical protein